MAIEAISITKLAPLITKLAGVFASPAMGVASRAKAKLEVVFRKGFSRFVEENLRRFAVVKTIISSSTPIPFSDLYVNLYVARSKAISRDEDFLIEIESYRNVLFSAAAGSGKSMLMRYLYLKFLEVQTERLPILIELRELNEHSGTSLRDYVQLKIADYIDGFSDKQLRYALETGRIILMLDGVDEINHDRRIEREAEINELAARFRNTWIFVSSRPAETFARWQTFHVFEVQPLTKQQVELLIDNIPYDADAKSVFKRKLGEGLYEEHVQFLTNPLLTIMMLITLEQFAEVPTKIHLFYEYAFEALFGKHDATKAGFQRKRHTSLPLDDFKRLFAYFCMITYARKTNSFTSDQTLSFIQQAIESSQIDVEKTLFRSDLTESVCMLIRDGFEYTFSHRSFQEYFTAYFLSRIKVDEFATIFPRLIERATSDNVVGMVAEMNREKFEEAWALPFLVDLEERIGDIDAQKDCVSFDAAVFGGWPTFCAFVLDANEEADSVMLALNRTGKARQGANGKPRLTEGRYALYQAYGVFREIHDCLEERGYISDLEMLRRIVDGRVLGDDSRFASWREKSGSELTVEDSFPYVELRPEDHSWFCETHWGLFLQLEGQLVPRLTKEVKDRVERRRKGLASILESSPNKDR
ncbi:NACHT domain-containing protein [Bradyrhizobium sp. LTSP885]|uniref:NACHT domain-containing protein n=1 Tax=Bradyrhizobium sp. LTSP885 TaxID=1619232 RepID=UPI000A8F1780|nr:NACHT domain-containing protein [Bradyrhizobium sp. LTSP885]